MLFRSLDEIAPQLLRQRRSLLLADFALVRPVTLVPDEDDRDRVGILDAGDLVPEALDALERRAGGYGVDEDETFAFAASFVKCELRKPCWRGEGRTGSTGLVVPCTPL